jgi:GT2 family glycosyltransferase
MVFSIIIPTVETRPVALNACLSQLAASVQSLDESLDYEVIVPSDNVRGPHAPLADWEIKFPFARRVQGPGRGPAANRNLGATHAQGDWLAFVDDDCVPDPNWLSAYAEAISQHPRGEVFEGRTIADRPKRRLDEGSPLNETGGYLWSCNFLIRRSRFEAMGGFDERFRFACMEDVNLRERLKAARVALIWTPAATVVHPWRLAPANRSWKQRQESHKIYYQIHPEKLSFGMVRSRWRRLAADLIYLPREAWLYRGRGLVTYLRRYYFSIIEGMHTTTLWWLMRHASRAARARQKTKRKSPPSTSVANPPSLPK